MRAGHVELFVRDPAASREFYERVLGFEVTAVQHGGRTVWLRCGEREFLLRPGEGPPPRATYARAAVGLVLFTDDLAGTKSALEARGLVFDGDDGAGCPTFKDLDGHWWQLVDPRHA